MEYKRVISPQWQSWRWVAKLAFIAFFFTLLTVFVADNFIMVEMHLILWSLETRLAWSLLLAAILGFSIGMLVARLRR
ncbi:MAG: hypothetical protein R6U37_00035 [Dehalococcoidia bacterium]